MDCRILVHELVKRKFRADGRKEKGENWKVIGWREFGTDMGHVNNMEQDTYCVVVVLPEPQMSKFSFSGNEKKHCSF